MKLPEIMIKFRHLINENEIQNVIDEYGVNYFKDGTTFLHIAMTYFNVLAVRVLLKNKADINVKNLANLTPLENMHNHLRCLLIQKRLTRNNYEKGLIIDKLINIIRQKIN